MDNIYFNRIQKLLVKSQIKLQELQKQKFFIDENQERAFNTPNLGFVLDNNEINKNVDKKKDNLEKAKQINKEVKKLDTFIYSLKSLEIFSQSINDAKIVSYVDGHLDEDENKLFKKIIEVDIKLKKDVELMKTANSFFGEFEEDIEDLDPSILQNWIQLEETAKKNSLNLTKPKIKTESLISKIKDFVTFKPMDFALAGMFPVIIGTVLLYGTNGIMMASNPAIIQLSQVSSYSKNSIVSGPIFRGQCLSPDISFNKTQFKDAFKITASNPDSKKLFKLSDNDPVLIGNKINFFLKTNLKGDVFIDVLDKSQSDTKCVYLNMVKQEFLGSENNFIKIGKTETISKPIGIDTILVKFKEYNKDEINMGVFHLKTIITEELEKKYLIKPTVTDKIKTNKLLPKKGIYNFYSKFFTEGINRPFMQSWGSNEFKENTFERVYIDFNGDGISEIIAVDSDKDGIIDHYKIDRNNNEVIDAIVFPLNKSGKLTYEWLLDNNEDRKFDGKAEDIDGDWKIDFTKNL